MKKLVLLTIAALILFGVTNVFGDTLKLISEVPQQVVSGHFDGLGDLSAYAGSYYVALNGIPTLTYCTEFQTITPGVTYTDYTVSPLTDSLTNERVAYIINNYAPSLTNLNQDVNAQVAIWEIISLDPGSLGTGDFSVNAWSGYGSLAGAQAIVDEALLAIKMVNDYSTSGVQLVHSPTAQDYVKVPEPGILILLGIALSAVGLVSRRYRLMP